MILGRVAAGAVMVMGALMSSVPALSQTIGTGMQYAPPSFEFVSGKKAVPIDFQNASVDFNFDVGAEKIMVKAAFEFTQAEDGYPMFDLVPDVSGITIDGIQLEPSKLFTVSDPDKVTKIRVMDVSLKANVRHQVELAYELTARDYVIFEDGHVRAGFFMSDIDDGGRQFWEQYAPSNYEFDAFSQVIRVEVTNTQVNHVIFTNGREKSIGPNKWEVSYPDYYTSSSFYFHVADEGHFTVAQGTFDHLDGPGSVPVLIYARSEDLATKGLQAALKVLKENETVYGRFAHERVVAYITSFGGGMEHCGATMTSLWALEHEFTHFWFARGVMPADGNAGWIDEAVASWRDDGYPRASSAPMGDGKNLGGFSPYRRHTSMLAYTYGANLIASFDRMFASATNEASSEQGMRAILRSMFNTAQRRTITVEWFREFLQNATGVDLKDLFDTYVYGKKQTNPPDVVDGEKVSHRMIGQPLEFASFLETSASRHPRPFTKDEIKSLL